MADSMLTTLEQTEALRFTASHILCIRVVAPPLSGLGTPLDPAVRLALNGARSSSIPLPVLECMDDVVRAQRQRHGQYHLGGQHP